MIERILNNYYAKKLLEEIKWSFIVRGLDYRFKNDKYEVFIEVKPQKYDKKYYSTIIRIGKDDTLKYLCDLKNFRKQIDEIIVEYQKGEK